MLERFLPRLLEGLEPQQEGEPLSVLVPLCGKTIDMVFLSEMGLNVVGVEGVIRALIEFRDEQRARVKGFKRGHVYSPAADGIGWHEGPEFIPSGTFTGRRIGFVFKKGDQGVGYYRDWPAAWRGSVYLSKGKHAKVRHVDVLQGDMFEITPALVAAATTCKSGKLDVVYDRASLQALPPSSWEEYVRILDSLLKPGGRMLLIVTDYDQSRVPENADGSQTRRGPPPFAVNRSHVNALFPAQRWSLEVLDDSLAEDPPDSIRGTPVREVTYLLCKRDGAHSPGSSSGSSRALQGAALVSGLGLAAAVLYGSSRGSRSN